MPDEILTAASTPQEAAPATDTPPSAPDLDDGGGSLLKQSLDRNSEGAAPDSEQSGTATGEPEQKADGEKPEEKKEPEGAPEQYADFKAPEGLELAPVLVDEFKGLAKDLNLSQEQAQAVIDRMAPKMAERNAEYVKQVIAEWQGRTTSDKEVGGVHLAEAQANAARILNRFGLGADGKPDPDIAEFVNSPMGNHPGALKLLARAGAAFGEARFPQGTPAGALPTAEDFYRSARRS